MKKFIFIVDALRIIAGLLKGEKFEGVLFIDKETHVLTFKAWNRTAPKYYKEKKICDLDFGFVGETAKHITRHEKFPKVMGTEAILNAMDRDNIQSREAVVDKEIVDNA